MQSTAAATPFLLLLLIGALATCAPERPSYAESSGYSFAARVVAHGGGALDGDVVTNSREALDASAALGFRLIEVDLSWTTDDRLVLLHDWEGAAAHLDSGVARPCDAATFLAAPLPGGRTPLDLDDALAWLKEHRACSLVTDVKTRNLDALRRIAERAGVLSSRVVPQVHDVAEAAAVRALGFERIILTLYASRLDDDVVLAFARESPPFAVTIPWRRALDGDLPARLSALGVPTYAHTVNDFPRAGALLDRGVWGVYTDLLHPDEGERAWRIAQLRPWLVTREGARPIGRAIDPAIPVIDSGVHPWGEFEGGTLAALESGGARWELTSGLEEAEPDLVMVDLHLDRRGRAAAPGPAVRLVVWPPVPGAATVSWRVTSATGGRRVLVRREPVRETQDVYRAAGPLDGLAIVGVEVAATDDEPTTAVARLETADGVQERRLEVSARSAALGTFALPRGATGEATLTVTGERLVVRSYGAPATLAALIDHD